MFTVEPLMYTGEGCDKCELVNAHGGPEHFNQSRMCHYRGRLVPHCTCRACWG